MDYIERQIQRKLDYNTPYYGKLGDVMQTETDFDNFPYNRFYRSVYDSTKPGIYDRKAGYRVLETAKYACPQKPLDTFVPDLTFSAPGSTTYPAYPTYFYEFAETASRNNGLNRYRINTTP